MNLPLPRFQAIDRGGLRHDECVDAVHVAALEAEVERLRAKLNDPGKCNAGHETLPLTLWDCPACTASLRTSLREITEAAQALVARIEAEGGHGQAVYALSRTLSALLGREGKERG